MNRIALKLIKVLLSEKSKEPKRKQTKQPKPLRRNVKLPVLPQKKREPRPPLQLLPVNKPMPIKSQPKQVLHLQKKHKLPLKLPLPKLHVKQKKPRMRKPLPSLRKKKHGPKKKKLLLLKRYVKNVFIFNFQNEQKTLSFLKLLFFFIFTDTFL